MDLLTEPETAALLRLAPKTLRNLRHDGGGPPYIKVGRTVRYPRPALNQWLADRTYTRSREPMPT